MTYLKPIMFLVISMFIVVSCGTSDEDASVIINYKLTFDGEPLAGFDNQQYPQGYDAFFTKFSLFISDVTLTNGSQRALLTEVDFIDLLTGINDVQSAQNGISRSYSDIEAGTFNMLEFNIGLPATTNLLTPADFASDHPLGNTAEYWVGWTSYIFHKLEGKYDSDGDGIAETNIALHLGSDDAFREVVVSAPVIINEGTNHINITFELLDILNIQGQYYDFRELSQIHNLTQLPDALPIVDNIRNGISVAQ